MNTKNIPRHHSTYSCDTHSSKRVCDLLRAIAHIHVDERSLENINMLQLYALAGVRTPAPCGQFVIVPADSVDTEFFGQNAPKQLQTLHFLSWIADMCSYPFRVEELFETDTRSIVCLSPVKGKRCNCEKTSPCDCDEVQYICFKYNFIARTLSIRMIDGKGFLGIPLRRYRVPLFV